MKIPDARVNHFEGHEKFSELCALYTCGALDRDELAELDAHLAGCAECRSSLADYEAIVRVSIPLLGDDAGFEETQGFEQEIKSGKERLLAALEPPCKLASANGASRITAWRYLQFAAFFLLSSALGVAGYQLGIRGARDAERTRSTMSQQAAELRAQVSDATEQRDQAKAFAERQVEDLHAKTEENNQQRSEIGRLEQMLELSQAGRSEDASAIAKLAAENASLKADHETASQAIAKAERNIAQLEQELERLGTQRVALQAEDLDRDQRIKELRDQISEQQRLLRADRDIRDLMGARDLLISDVIDVDTRGHSKKPFGRIFYTKNKSLIFYAFDLDRQPGLRNASAFQAWGARATSKGNENPVSMGIFYKDNASAERWVLKVDDPKVLEQIDSVFVTVEPQGGSNKPSGTQFLFAFLRGEANHP